MNKDIIPYWWYKSHKICPYCRVNDARKGKTSCPDCADRFAEMWLNSPPRTTEQKEHMKKRNRKYRDLLVAFGVCQICAKRNALKGRTMCLDCLTKRNRESRNRRYEKGSLPLHLRYNSGFCYFCYKKIADGQLICDECKIKKAKCVEYARTFIDREKLRKCK